MQKWLVLSSAITTCRFVVFAMLLLAATFLGLGLVRRGLQVGCVCSVCGAVLGDRRRVASKASERPSFPFRGAAAVGVEDYFANAIHVHDLLCDAAAASRTSMVVDKFSRL
jgi:hypothetical protein